jgi:hypothetical protein
METHIHSPLPLLNTKVMEAEIILSRRNYISLIILDKVLSSKLIENSGKYKFFPGNTGF